MGKFEMVFNNIGIILDNEIEEEFCVTILQSWRKNEFYNSNYGQHIFTPYTTTKQYANKPNGHF